MGLQIPSYPELSVEDYLAGEQQSEIRHEYIDGQVYAMVGASDRHGLIVNALAFALTPAARRRGCQLFTSDMKVRLEIGGSSIFYYPDLLLSCDGDDRHAYFRSSPCLIVEVLSESTQRVDRQEKFLSYRQIPSLQEYLLVAQDERRLECFRRSRDWRGEILTQGGLYLACLELELSLDEVYQDLAN
ncbi:Uma2 family endonuclease [Magnetovirga frankeli]|uniref:Uma2 family endonuclease n=1 Tax=Magnetovirga frankeli TaxID=947516 RepID=UPI001294036E|nr:Uma2 family endonuclease [gamma proteobacterium SS-5]